jgi:hypothetical protein
MDTCSGTFASSVLGVDLARVSSAHGVPTRSQDVVAAGDNRELHER